MSQLPASNKSIRNILVALSLVALAIMVWRVSDIVVITFGGLVVAAAIRALVDPLAKITKISERWCLGIVIVGGLVVLWLLAWLFGNQASAQTVELQKQLPQAMAKFEAWLQSSSVGQYVVTLTKQSAADSKLLSGVGLAATAVLGSVANLFLIGFLGIYFAIDPRLYRDGTLRLFPLARREEVKGALDDAGDALRRWLLGQMIAMVVVGVVLGASLAVIGMPLSLTLGLLMGICEFVPVVGPIVAAIPGVLLAFATSPQMAFYVFVIYVVVQQLESNILIPLIQRWATKLAPAVGLIAVVVFGILFGVLGIVFATPIAVVLTALVKHLYVEDALEHRPLPKKARVDKDEK